jgi:probable rRNA maturation factor
MSLPPPEGARSPSLATDTPLNVDVELSVEDGLEAAWDEPRITRLVHSIVRNEFPGVGEFAISLHLVGNETIRALNAEHRGTDAHTDVLSFPLHDPNGMRFVLPPNQPAALGDVVISFPVASAQAEEFGHSVDREIGYLVAHGVLHVLGYDHEDEDDQRRMRQQEEDALRPLGFTR